MTETLAASPLVRAIALALVEFVWQGAAIGLATALVLFFLRTASAPLRYIVACAGLAAMTLAPLVTAAGYLREERNPAHVRATVGMASPETLAIPDDPILSVAAGLEPRLLFRSWVEPRLPLVMAVWCSGVLLMSAHLLGGWLRVRRIRGSATLLERSRWPERVAAMAGRFRLTRPVRLLVSSVVEVPAVIGCVRPAILVPASALSGLSPLYLEAILLHELAHVRRGDYLVNVGQCVVEVLLFYHPAVWWVSNQIRREREHCCDDIAASLCADQVTYARALTSLEELRIPMPRLAVGAAGGDLLARIRRLVEPDRVSSPRLSGGLAMGVVFTLALLALNVQIGSSSIATQQNAAPAGLSGVVRDQAGGVVPGVTIALRRSPSDPPRTATTDSRGEWAFADVPAGKYELTISQPGFRPGGALIELAVGQTRRIDVQLNIGSVTEWVTVQSTANFARRESPERQPPVNPQTAEDYFEVARVLYAQERSAEASKYLQRALELARPSVRSGSTITDAAPSAKPTGPIRVGGSIREPRKIRHVPPIYPPEAVAAGVDGIVVLDAVIATDGTVKDVTVLNSAPMLEEAARAAVRLWQFTPTMLNGVPVEVAITVTVHFAR